MAIGFDIVFAEPDRMSPALAAASFRGLDAATRDKLAALPSNDEVLADAIKQAGVVVVGQAGSATPAPRSEAGTAPQTGFAIRGPDPRPFLVTFPGLLRNVPSIEQAAAGRGLFSISPERDGIVRRVPVVMVAQETLVPSLTLEMLRVVTRAGAILIRTDEAGVRAVAVPGLEVPTDRNGQFWVHFNKHDPARYVSAADVLHGRTSGRPLSRPAGAHRHLGDRSPRHQDHAGRAGDARRRGPRPDPRERADQGAAGTARITPSAPSWSPRSCSGSPSSSPRRCCRPSIVVALGAVLIAGLVGLSWYFFVAHNLLIDFTYPLMSSWLIYLVLTFVNYFREQQQRQQIRSAFGFYLSPHAGRAARAARRRSWCSAAKSAA